MDMKEFTAKLEEATKKLSAEERASLVKIFQTVSDDVNKTNVSFTSSAPLVSEGTDVPEGITPRLQALKNQYLKAQPTISLIRAVNLTRISKENEGMPKPILRGTAFKEFCKIAPFKSNVVLYARIAAAFCPVAEINTLLGAVSCLIIISPAVE